MSKIALSSNALGTGTLTIAAPNTNTDRTLTLPDGSGALYNQSNIVGTVSQSGGVPTGAIIERGSNANGEFVKFADGTMICTRSSIVTTAVATAAGALFFPGGLPTTLATAATFSSIPEVSISIRGVFNSLVGYEAVPTVSTFGAFYHLAEVARASQSYRYSLIAIGRWF